MLKKLQILVLFLLVGHVFAQEIKPVGYWDFEGEDWKKSRFGSYTLVPDWDPPIKSLGSGMGKYLSLPKGNSLEIKTRFLFENAITIEFIFRIRPGEMNPQWKWFWSQDRSLFASINPNFIYFDTYVRTALGKYVYNRHEIPLKGAGAHSMQYYTDGKWHHMVFKYNASNGRKEIWVDGVLPEGFSTVVAEKGTICRQDPCSQNIIFSDRGDAGKQFFVGDIDEIALYDRFVPSELHCKHAVDLRQQKPYDFVLDRNRNVIQPQIQNVEMGIDPKEYAPGHPDVISRPIDQLRSFPAPRYFPGHQLIRNFNWMGMTYFGEGNFPGVDQQKSVQNSVEIEEELVLNWYYMLVFQNTLVASREANLTNAKGYFYNWIKLANQYPEIPLSVTTLWAQVRLKDIGDADQRQYIKRRDLPPAYYLNDGRRNSMNRKGATDNKRSVISPAAPGDLFRRDGQVQKLYLERVLKYLKRPIFMINENGEMPPLPLAHKVLEKDPAVVKHKESLGLTDWDIYQARQKTRFRSLYANEFLSLPELKNTIFTWYGVDAGPLNLDRFEWTEARKISTKINGQYYSTPDFYPRWPRNWEKWAGPWRGWNWIEVSRKTEIATGDKLFSPFIAAGWSKDPEKNIRSSQWLGLLKNLGVVGAEFYYTGFFNEQQWPNLAHPRNYAWQAVIPSYAQAITSRYEDILRNGNVLMDEDGAPIIRHWAGNPSILVTVRKYDIKPVFIISGNINPISNVKGNVPDQKIARINLDGEILEFQVRRQGSVYLYDKTNPSAPVFYQLDTWHEAGHPSWWSDNFRFEAEVFDDAKSITIQTRRKRNVGGDFSEFVSYITSKGKGCAEYSFRPRKKSQKNLVFRILARSLDGKSTGVDVNLDGKTIGRIDCISDTDWNWTDVCGGSAVLLSNLSLQTHILELKPINSSFQLDKFELITK